MAETPLLSFPYPIPTDSPDGPAQIQALAEALEAELIKRTPVGTVRMSIKATPDPGWLVCNGGARLKADYPELDAILLAAGYPYGSDATHFNLPDMRGRQPVGVGTHADVLTLGLDDGLAVGSRTPKHAHGPGSYATAAHNHGPGTLGVEGHDHPAGTLIAQNHHHGPGTLATGAHSHGAGTLAAAAHSHAPGTFKAASHTHGDGTLAAAAHNHGPGTLSGSAHNHGSGTLESDGSHVHAIPTTDNTGGPWPLVNVTPAINGVDVGAATHLHNYGGINTELASSKDAVIGTTAASTVPITGLSASVGTDVVGATGSTNPAVEGVSANTAPSVNGITANATAALATGVSGDSQANIAGATATDAPDVTRGATADASPAITGSSAIASAGYQTIYFQIKATQ